jgi:hypothetical protein
MSSKNDEPCKQVDYTDKPVTDRTEQFIFQLNARLLAFLQ